MVRALVSQLRRAGELDETYIIFQSDNGLLRGEHGISKKNVPWDKSVRVPLVIRGPGFERNEVRRDLTANVDVPATIFDAAGVDPAVPADGYSLLGSHSRRFLLLERLLGARDEASRGTRSWRQIKTASGWTYWSGLNGKREHLYNLSRDPHQLRNRARDKPKLAGRLATKAARSAECADPCP